MYKLYILRNSVNKLYIGQTKNLEKRLQEHKTSKGAKYLRDFGKNFKLVYTEKYPTLIKAMRREKQIKGWTRAKKEALISGNKIKLKEL